MEPMPVSFQFFHVFEKDRRTILTAVGTYLTVDRLPKEARGPTNKRFPPLVTVPRDAGAGLHIAPLLERVLFYCEPDGNKLETPTPS